MKFYCMKEKKKVEVSDYKEKKNKRGIRVGFGVCPHCGTKVYKILGK